MDAEVTQARANNGKKLRRKRQKLLAVTFMRDFGQNTTLHGLRYITDTGLSHIEKLFWIVTFLISIGLCTYQIHNVWLKWQMSPVIVALSEHLVSVGEVPFPSVTICPRMKAKRSVYNLTAETARLMKKDQDNLNWTLDETNRDPSVDKFEDIGLICEKSEFYKFRMRNYSDTQVIEHIIDVSPTLSDVFHRCKWRNVEFPCEELFKPMLTYEGLCYNMNSLAADEMFRIENVQQNYSYLNTSEPSRSWSYTGGYSSTEESVYPRRGRGNGGYKDLSVILKEITTDRDGLCRGTIRGYQVYLQHPADMPQSSFYYFDVMPERTTSNAITLSIFNTSTSLKSYPPETRQCYFPEERQLKYFRTYTANNCRLECLSNYTYELCGCVWFHMPHSNSASRICREGKRECVRNVAERFAAEEGYTESKVGSCHCLPSCVGIQYNAETRKTTFDAINYLHAVKSVSTDNLTGHDGIMYMRMDLFYKESWFISMHRSELFGPTDFLANCGGLLGLFLGFSFLSLVEIFYFCTLRLSCILRREKALAENVSSKNEPVITRM